MSNIKELIRAEIERLKSKYRHNGLWTSSFQSDLAMAKIESMNELLSFLDTMPDEPVTDCHDLEKEIKEQIYERFYDLNGIAVIGTSGYAEVKDMEDIARHFAEWGAEHLRDTTKKISEDLEEAAEEYATMHLRNNEFPTADSAFKAGAEWQKRKMMEGAVECSASVCKLADKVWVTPNDEKKFHKDVFDHFIAGDKVRIIIAKEGEQ